MIFLSFFIFEIFFGIFSGIFPVLIFYHMENCMSRDFFYVNNFSISNKRRKKNLFNNHKTADGIGGFGIIFS